MNTNTNTETKPTGENCPTYQKLVAYIEATKNWKCCSGCDDQFPDNELTRDDYNEFYCDDCFDERYAICNDCDCYLDKEEEDDEWETIKEDGKWIPFCNDCRDDRRHKLLEELKEIGRQAYLADGMTEVPAVCYECGFEGKCLQAEGEEGDDWMCLDCSSA